MSFMATFVLGMAIVALVVARQYEKNHRKHFAVIEGCIATIRDTRVALENRRFRVVRREFFESASGIEGEVLFEKFGVQAAHVVMPADIGFPHHVHEDTGEIYVVTRGGCSIRVYSDEKKALLLLDRELNANSPLIRGRVAYIDPGSWHEISAGISGCEILNFSIPPHVFDLGAE